MKKIAVLLLFTLAPVGWIGWELWHVFQQPHPEPWRVAVTTASFTIFVMMMVFALVVYSFAPRATANNDAVETTSAG